jgi:nitrite reductase (NO-forming)
MQLLKRKDLRAPWRGSSWVWAAVCAGGMACAGDGSDDLPRRTAAVYAGRPPAAPTVQLPLHSAPRLYPAEPGRLKAVHLEVTPALIDLGRDGKFAGLSFAGQIPGPTLRVREGDRVRFTLTNRSNASMPNAPVGDSGPQAFALGGFLLDRAEAERRIAPGETLELEATAMTPGVHLYTGTLPNAAEAIARGLYGLIVIDPADGYATRADREYALVQSELYAGKDSGGTRVGNTPMSVLDREAMKGKRPSHLGYAGHFAGAGDLLRLPAEPQERLRFFVFNVGPNAGGRLQIAGVPFDRFFPSDVLGEKPNPAGPATLAPGAGAVLELVIPKKGRYRLADRSFAERGLLATIDASQGEPEPPSAEALAALRPRTPAQRRERGREIYTERCVACHDPPPETVRLAPSLSGVFQRRSRQWLVSWLTDPPKMQAEDPTAQELMRQWNNIPMPPVMLSPEQIEWVLEFLSAGPGGNKKI